LTRKGALYYGVQIGRQDVYVAMLDAPTGRVLGAPSPLTRRYVGSNSLPFWSPDGQYVAFSSERRPGSKVIVIRSTKTGAERELAPNLDHFDLGPWSPDGRSLLLHGMDTGGHRGVFRIDIGDAAISPLVVAEPGTDASSPRWSSDGKAVFFRRGIDATQGSSLVVRDLETGREKELYRAELPSFIDYNVDVSPDGAQLAFPLMQSRNQPRLLMVISTSGGEPRKLLEVYERELIPSITWTADSHSIVFAKGRALLQDSKDELWRISAEGGAPEKLGLTMDWLGDLRLHPDGQRIAFTAGQNKSEVWVLENFLPVLRATKP
jgi:Tol biopolymer transport system component